MKKKWLRYWLPFILVAVAFVYCQIGLGKGAPDFMKISRTLKGQLVPICAWIVMALSLNLVVGVSGELSLGHAGFMSIGAFSGVVVSACLVNAGVENLVLRLVLTMAASALFAGVAGVLIGIPVLRLSGDYLAIVTLAFGEIIRNILNCVYISLEESGAIHFGFLNEKLPGTMLVNGPNGATVSAAVKVPTLDGFIAGFVLIIFTLIVIQNLVYSRSGRAIMAVRDNRIAAETNGINVMKYRMMAFVVSAALAGMAGALYGLNMPTFLPGKFKFDQSINVLVFVVLGGIGNMTGSIISATLLTILPETLRAFSDYRMLAYAIVLVLVMLITNNVRLKTWFGTLKSKVFGKGNDESAGKGEA